MTSSSGNQIDTLATSLGALEANVLIAGLEAVAAIFVWWAIVLQRNLLDELPSGDWKWQYSLGALLGILGVSLLGLLIEAIAGVSERWIVHDGNGNLRRWYVKATSPPATWGPAQRWIWKSPQASAEFARRRLRILVTRNSAVIAFLLLATILVGLPFSRPSVWVCWWVGALVIGAGLIAAFHYLWIDASAAWHRAIREAGEHEGS